MKTVILLLASVFCFMGVALAAPVNVSCTDSVKSLNKIAEGKFTVICPVNCKSGSIWGTNNMFTTDSAICVAAVHEGIIADKGGWVGVKILPGQASYAGQMKNGVLTQSWQAYDSSFTLSK